MQKTLVMAVVAALGALGCAGTAQRPDLQTAWPLVEFCSAAQQLISSTELRASNVVHDDYQAFVLSKPKVRPLETEQFHWYEDPARMKLKMISCKMKTTDHLRAEYGDSAAGTEGLCAAVNQHSLAAVLTNLRRARHGKLRYEGGRRIVFDPEELTNLGPEWLKSHEIAWEDAQGLLHVQSRAMRNDWLDPRYLRAPPQFRGTRYCHLIAPDYLQRLLTGATPAPRARGEAVSTAVMPPTPPG
jgi:hypothetical protein